MNTSGTGDDGPGALAGWLLGVVDSERRRAALESLCRWLGCEDVLLFVPDPDLGIAMPAPGFPQTLPGGREWRALVQACQQHGRQLGSLAYPTAGTMRTVLCLAAADSSVVALVGGSPNEERSSLLLHWIPLTAAALKAHQTAEFATQRANFERQATAQSRSLAERLDAVARENNRLFREAERNLAERRRVEAEQRRFVALIENSSDCIGLFTPAGEVLFLNRGGLSMLGLADLEAARGLCLEQFFEASQRTYASEHIIPQVLSSGRWTGETQFVNQAGGNIIEVHQTTFRITGAHEPGPILAMIARDITDAKRAEQLLRHTAKLESLGIMAGGIAHDFNNLLTGIMGNASLLVSMLPPAEAELAQEIVKSSERAAHLTHQMLAYAGQGHFQLAPLDLSREVREVLTIIKSSIDANVRLHLELAPGLPLVQADPGQIQQLVMNLLINASEAIRGKRGSITVRTGVRELPAGFQAQTFGPTPLEPGNFVTLEVRDTGEGMSDETLTKIFDPFFTTKFTGRGLGLAAVSGIIRGHRGALKVASTRGRGTTFEVMLPAGAAAAAPEFRPVLSELAGAGTVLVIDDEAMVRQVAKAVLESKGYQVLLAEDGIAGLETYAHEQQRIAIVVLDLTMPKLGGEDTLFRLRQIRPDVAVILSSGYNEADIMGRFASQPVAGFLQKPYTATQLLARIQEIMQERGGVPH